MIQLPNGDQVGIGDEVGVFFKGSWRTAEIRYIDHGILIVAVATEGAFPIIAVLPGDCR
jgi:hypothetical protein